MNYEQRLNKKFNSLISEFYWFILLKKYVIYILDYHTLQKLGRGRQRIPVESAVSSIPISRFFCRENPLKYVLYKK